jgi:hypothetical protein
MGPNKKISADTIHRLSYFATDQIPAGRGGGGETTILKAVAWHRIESQPNTCMPRAETIEQSQRYRAIG